MPQRLGASTEEINVFFISTQVMQENLLTKDTPWGSCSARRFKQQLAQILCIPRAPEERDAPHGSSVLLMPSIQKGPSELLRWTTCHACYVLLLPRMLCGFNHLHLNFLLYRFNQFVTCVVLYQENVANKISFLSDATRISCLRFFFPFCKYKHLKRKYKAKPMIASRQEGWWYITTADNEI